MKRKIMDIEECGVSITTAFDSFITTKKSEGRREATLRSYTGSFKDFLKFCDDKGYTDISEINKDLVEKYKLHLLDKDVSVETRNTYLRTLKAFTSYLFEEENLTPFKIKLFQAPVKEEVSVYSDEEIKETLELPIQKLKVIQRGKGLLFDADILTYGRKAWNSCQYVS